MPQSCCAKKLCASSFSKGSSSFAIRASTSLSCPVNSIYPIGSLFMDAMAPYGAALWMQSGVEWKAPKRLHSSNNGLLLEENERAQRISAGVTEARSSFPPFQVGEMT